MHSIALECIGIDFETADHQADSACAIGLAQLKDGVLVDTFYSLIRPPRSHVHFTRIHGLTWAMLKKAPTFAELWPAIAAFMGAAPRLVAHNAHFDKRILRGCCTATGVRMLEAPFFCTCKGARRGLALANNKLNTVCAYLGIALNHHHAGSDAAAAAYIYARLRALGVQDSDMCAT